MSTHAGMQYDPFRLFEAAVAQAPDAIIFIDRSGAIGIWNLRAEAVFGYSAAEVLGKSVDLIIPERLRTGHGQGFRRAIETGGLRHAGRVLTTRAVHKNGSKLYLDLSFSLFRDDAGTVAGALAIARDCTAREVAQRARTQPAG